MAKLIQATLTSDSNWVTINGDPHLRGTFVRFDPVSFDGDLGVEVSFSSLNKLYVAVDGTTVNGSDVSTQQELIDWFKTNSFKIGGGTGEGVQSVSAGDGINVDNTDPYNPIISATGGGGGGDAVWGGISGTLSNQTDLKNALDAKADLEDLSDVALSGSYADLDNIPTTFTPAAHTHTASQISDSTATGRSVLTAADAAAARTALGLGSASTQATSAFATSAQGAKADSALQAADIAGKSNNAITVVGESGATLTYGLTHAGLDKIVRTTGGGSKTHTVPPQSSVAWPDGSVINLATPSSNVTIAAGSGVNIIAPVEPPWVIEPNTLATLTRLGSNEWVLAARFAE